jgi:uncharacterized protein YggE
MIRLFSLLYLLLSGLAFAQNSITVTATRNSSVQPDQAVFRVSVTSGLTTGRDDVIAALQGSGIGLANFSSVYSIQNYVNNQLVTVLQWNFTLTVPLANLKPTIDTFTGLQMSLAKGTTGMTLSFSVQGLQASPQAQQAQPCSLAGLISDARAQATSIANAAGSTVGSILAVTNSVSDTAVICSATVKFALGSGF